MVGTPFIPRTITVHLGPPDSAAENVYVSFPDYIKNVASSEIYPTWPEAALRANIYAQISYALNRYYTEWYRSQGYDFDINPTSRGGKFTIPSAPLWMIFSTRTSCVAEVLSLISPSIATEPPPPAMDYPSGTRCPWHNKDWDPMTYSPASTVTILIL